MKTATADAVAVFFFGSKLVGNLGRAAGAGVHVAQLEGRGGQLVGVAVDRDAQLAAGLAAALGFAGALVDGELLDADEALVLFQQVDVAEELVEVAGDAQLVLDLVDGGGLDHGGPAGDGLRLRGHRPARAADGDAGLPAQVVQQVGELVVLGAGQVRDVRDELGFLLLQLGDRALQAGDGVLLLGGVLDLALDGGELGLLLLEDLELQVVDRGAARDEDQDEGDDPDDGELFLVHFGPPGVGLLMGVEAGLAPGGGGALRLGGVARPNIAIWKSMEWVSPASFSFSSLTFQSTSKLISVRV